MISRTLQFVMAAGFAASCGVASAAIVTVGETPFVGAAATGVITFHEDQVSLGAVNPAFTAAGYGGSEGTGTPDVAFGAYFVGQSQTDACKFACVIGSPTVGSGGLALVPEATASVATRVDPGGMPDSPILTGRTGLLGPIAMLFSHDVLGVGFDIGHLSDGAEIRAYNAAGGLVGFWTLGGDGVSFFGIGSDDTTPLIRALVISQPDVFGDVDPFGIDNVRFLAFEAPKPPTPPTPAPEPGSLLLVGLGLLAAGAARRRAG